MLVQRKVDTPLNKKLKSSACIFRRVSDDVEPLTVMECEMAEALYEAVKSRFSYIVAVGQNLNGHTLQLPARKVGFTRLDLNEVEALSDLHFIKWVEINQKYIMIQI